MEVHTPPTAAREQHLVKQTAKKTSAILEHIDGQSHLTTATDLVHTTNKRATFRD